MKANQENLIRVFHLNSLTREERDALNSTGGGWDSDPRFTRYLDVTVSAKMDAVREAWKLGEFHEAADVETDSLDMAYMLTNNISYVWSQNGEVEPLTDEFKSTSVGDVILKDGEYFLVAPMGFEKIDDLIDIDLTDDEPEITCGACSVAIGAHTNDENCRKEKQSHWYATNVFGWATSEVSREDAIERLAQRFRPDVQRIIKSEKKNSNDGMYFWSCRVLAAADAPYKIEWFAPVGVEYVEAQEHAVTRCTLKTVEHHVTKGAQS